MSRSLTDILNKEMSPDNIGNYTPNEVADFFIKIGVIENAADFSRLAIESIQKAYIDEDEFPIHYYRSDEPMHEEAKYPDPGPALTDDFIDNLKD